MDKKVSGHCHQRMMLLFSTENKGFALDFKRFLSMFSDSSFVMSYYQVNVVYIKFALRTYSVRDLYVIILYT